MSDLPLPALSQTAIKLLLKKTPAHVWHETRGLNPDWQPKDDGKFDAGTAAHALFLEKDASKIAVLPFDSFRSNAAKEARDAARADGKTPLTEAQFEEVQALAQGLEIGVSRIDADPPLFTDGTPEQRLEWWEGDVFCKGFGDWVRDDLGAIDDLKTTSSAAPEVIERHLFSMHYDVQAAFYLRWLRSVGGPADARFRFVFVETDPPHSAACYELSPAALAIANQKVDWAIGVWRRCLTSGVWPSYPTRVMTVDPPAWEEDRFYDREEREAA